MAVSGYVHANRKKEIKLQAKATTTNGVVIADEGYDGLSKVTVNVPTSGGGDNPLIASNSETMESYFSEENVGKVALFTGENNEGYEHGRLYSVEYVIPKYTHIYFNDEIDPEEFYRTLPPFEPIDSHSGIVISGDNQYDITEDKYVFIANSVALYITTIDKFNEKVTSSDVDVVGITDNMFSLIMTMESGEEWILPPIYTIDEGWKNADFKTFIVLQDTAISQEFSSILETNATSEIIIPTVIPKGTQITLNDTLDIESLKKYADIRLNLLNGWFYNIKFKTISDDKLYSKFGYTSDDNSGLSSNLKDAIIYGINDATTTSVITDVYKDGVWTRPEYKTIEFTEDYVAHYRWFSENSNLDTVLGVK